MYQDAVDDAQSTKTKPMQSGNMQNREFATGFEFMLIAHRPQFERHANAKRAGV